MKGKLEDIGIIIISGLFIFIQTFISVFILLWILQFLGAIDNVSYAGIAYFSLIYPIIIIVIGIFSILFDKNKETK